MNAATFKKYPPKTTLFYINMYIIYVFTPNFFAFINSNQLLLCFFHHFGGIAPFLGAVGVGGGSFFGGHSCVQNPKTGENVVFQCSLGPNIFANFIWVGLNMEMTLLWSQTS